MGFCDLILLALQALICSTKFELRQQEARVSLHGFQLDQVLTGSISGRTDCFGGF